MPNHCEYCNHEHAPDPFYCIARLQEDHEREAKAVRLEKAKDFFATVKLVSEQKEQIAALKRIRDRGDNALHKIHKTS